MELWNKLKSLFDDSGFTHKISLLGNFISMIGKNCDSVPSYINQLLETAQQLRGIVIPEKFAPVIMAMKHSGITITSDRKN